MRDNNTGLVWERSPSPNNNRKWDDIIEFPGTGALDYCLSATIGGAVGWRLPSVVELKSLQDPSLPPPYVPLSVFSGVAQVYWSSTTYVASQNVVPSAWIVWFVGEPMRIAGKLSECAGAWCVRGHE